MSDDYYETLGVGSAADTSTIKKAFYRIAKDNHPDRAATRGWGSAERAQREEKLKKAAMAYSVLSNATYRKEYDAEQRQAHYNYYRRRRPSWNPKGAEKSGVPAQWAGFNFEDLRDAQPPPVRRRRRKPREINTDYKSFREMASEAAERILCELILDALD